MKAFDEAFYVGVAQELLKLRKILSETPYIERMPSSVQEWEDLDNLIAHVEQAGELCRPMMDTAAGIRGEEI